MRLIALDTPESIELAASWLSDERNYRWLDFGNGVQKVDVLLLRVMLQREVHVIRAYTADDGTPIGLVGLSAVDRTSKSAWLWAVLGEKRYARSRYTLRAATAILEHGFRVLGLRVVGTWIVACNRPSINLAKHIGMNPAGRLRNYFYHDGKYHDRLLYDMLATEYLETSHDRTGTTG